MSIFASAELGHDLSKEEYEREEPTLRQDLLATQIALQAAGKKAVLVIVAGVDGAGKGEVVNRLNEWMDPRHIKTRGFLDPTDEECARPPMWRFWQALPPKGKIGIFFGSWYTDPLLASTAGELDEGDHEHALDEIVKHEKMLADEGITLVKLWFHLSKKAQKKRLRSLEKDPRTRWRVTAEDWERYAAYDEYRAAGERTLRVTSRQEAPWHVIEGLDPRYREVAAGRILLDRMKAAVADDRVDPPVDPPPSISRIDRKRITAAIDLTRKLDKDQYDEELAEWQGRLARLLRKRRFVKNRAVVAVFEGMDAAGKGGAIRRVTGALDMRWVSVVPIAAPTDEERAQPYLWRFWRHLPMRGRMTIFDRSWYGRVLVERVEGFATPYDWTRAYAEINDFEEQLVRHGVVVAKMWLQISQKEQLARFKERESTPWKQFKIGPEDWRNRKQWKRYDEAVCDVVDRTSTEIAPWALIGADDKRWARVQVLKTMCERLEAAR